MSIKRQTFTVAEAAVVLGISRSKVYELVAEGAIPTLPLRSRRRLIARVALEALLGAPLQGPPSESPEIKSTPPHDAKVEARGPVFLSQTRSATSHSCTRGGGDSGR